MPDQSGGDSVKLQSSQRRRRVSPLARNEYLRAKGRQRESSDFSADAGTPRAPRFFCFYFAMPDQEIRFRLTIPMEEAFAFAMGESDLNYTHVTDEMRQVIGLLVIDTLEYGEQWRVAADARASLAARWPGCFAF